MPTPVFDLASEEIGNGETTALSRLRSLSDIAMQTSRAWCVAMLIAAILSVVRVHVNSSGDVSATFAITSLTAVFAALVWLPSLLRVVGLAGGAVRTPAGEATTTGLVEVPRLSQSGYQA